MSGDYTRFTFDPRKRYSGVLMQQGRVQLDSDWNEGVDIAKRRVRTLSLDTFGPVGVPHLTHPNAFLIGLVAGPPLDLTIAPGRLYVEGLLAEHFPEEGATYLSQPFLPDPPPLPTGDAVVYLDVWDREVTYIEDGELLDVALGGADTATRTQTIWQVRVDAVDAAECGMDVGDPPSAGRLSVEAIAPPAPDDPCILPPVAGYRGLENRLYRLEIHEGGALGTARFKWSRDNGSIVSVVTDIAVSGAETTLTVNRIGRDQVLRFAIGNWVSVTDDHRELMGEPAEMAEIVDIDEANRRIVLDRALPTGTGRAFGANAQEIADRHTRVQRWDQTAATNAIDGDGLIVTAAGPIDLEAGIRVSFGMDPVGGAFRTGDHWVFAARVADASVEELVQAPPRGIVHHYVQLAAITGLGGAAPELEDCRPGRQAEACCCTVVVPVGGSIQAAIDSLPPEGGCVCLKPGLHTVTDTIVIGRGNVLFKGESPGVTVERTTPGLVLALGNAAGFGVSGIHVTTIDFTGTPSADDQGALAAMAACEEVVIEHCGFAAGRETVNTVGLWIVRSDDVLIRRNRFENLSIGIVATGLSEGLRLEANTMELGTGNQELPAVAGIAVLGVPAACRIERNRISGALLGIVLNDNLFGGAPRSSSAGSIVSGNEVICAELLQDVTGDIRFPGIDCAADRALVAHNQVSYADGWHFGIRLTGASSKAIGNTLQFTRAELELLGPVGLVIGHAGEDEGAATTMILATGNTVVGAHHGIFVIDATDVTVDANAIGTELGQVGFAVGLSQAREVTVSNNRIREALFGVTAADGRHLRVVGNDLADGGAGISLTRESGPALSQNRIASMLAWGILELQVLSRSDVVENRITDCGSGLPTAIGIAGVLVFGEFHVEANEVTDTGVPPEGGNEPGRAIGIFGDLILEARVESNLVTYTNAFGRDPEREDRALLMRGFLEQRIPLGQFQLTFGFAVQIVDNKFVGNGRSALVELTQTSLTDNIHIRFERVFFNQNYCMHVSGPPDDNVATVVLVGRSAIVMGNHIKATLPGFFSVDFNGMPGPFIGNITAGGVLQHTDFPVPEGNFNMQM